MATQTQTVQKISVRPSRVYDYLYGKMFRVRSITQKTAKVWRKWQKDRRKRAEDG